MAKIKRIRFVVEGSGIFPFDMLRYDSAWPESEMRDSSALAQGFHDAASAYGRQREVTLLSDSPHAPTVGRWRSFGWNVLSQETVV